MNKMNWKFRLIPNVIQWQHHHFVKLWRTWILCMYGGGGICVWHVLLKWCFFECPKILYIEIEMLFETSLSVDHDQSSVCVCAQWAGLGPQGQCMTPVVYLPSLFPGASGTSTKNSKGGFTDNVTSRLCFLCYSLIFLLNVAFQLDPTSYVLRKL